MAYNKDNLNGVKGRIGELIFANFIFDKFEIVSHEDPGLQSAGVDFTLLSFGKINTKVDVKLSDKTNDIFSMFYNNGTNMRHPFVPTCQADYIGIVQFDWKTYQKDNEPQKAEEELCKDLEKYIPEESRSIITEAVALKKNGLKTLKELYVAHRTVDRLQKENDDILTHQSKTMACCLDSTYSIPDTLELLDKYVLSISLVQVSRIKDICRPFSNMQSGWEIRDNKGDMIVRKAPYGSGCYAAEISFEAVKNHSQFLYKKDLKIGEAISDPSVPEIETETIKFKYKWKSKRPDFLGEEFGKTLYEMKKSSIEWILKESINKSSSIYKFYYELDKNTWDKKLKEEFIQELQDLIK